MKNFFSGLSSFVKKQENTLSEKMQTLKSSVRNKVLALTGGIIIGASSPAIAADWKKVETAGIGPREFAMQNFQTENWRQLTDRNGNAVRNPSTDLILGREYTIEKKKIGTIEDERKILTQNKGAPQILTPQEILDGKDPDDIIEAQGKTEIKKTLIQTSQQKKAEPTGETKKATPQKKIELSKQEGLLKRLFGTSFGDLMGLDFPTYKTAIAGSESGGSYSARNDKIGRVNNVPSSKWAWGKYQFTTETLARFGVNLREKGHISEKLVQNFLGNTILQEKLMEEYTRETLDKIKGNARLIKIIEDGKKPLPEILAKGHIGGHGSIEYAGTKTDWLKTPITSYARTVGKRYLSLIASNDSVVQNPIISSEQTIIEAPKNIESVASIEKVAFSQTRSANDAMFTTQQATSRVLSGIQNTKVRASLEEKFSHFESEHAAISSYMNTHRKEAIRLKKLALTIIGPSRELYLKESNTHVQRANDLKIVLETLEKKVQSTPLRKAA